MINIEAIKNMLESQGKLDFKPFHFENAEQEYWAFRTSDNKFHICDNDLKEIDRYDLKSKSLFKSWSFCDYNQKVLFVLERESDYLFFEEGVTVFKIQEEQPYNLVKNVWLINDWDGEIVAKDIIGYRYIGEKWIIFETTTIEISENENRYWIPNNKIACYNPSELKESSTFYCGTYNDYWDLFYCDKKYYIECRDLYGKESHPHNFENLVIWFGGSGVLAIEIQNNKGLHRICVYNPAVQIPTLYDYYYGDNCLGSYDLSICCDSNEINYFANKNVFTVSSYRPCLSSWITIDRYGNVGSVVNEIKGKIISVCNDVIKLDHSVCNYENRTYDFYDYKGNCLAKDINQNAHFIVISKSYNSALFEDESDSNLISLKGVLNAQNHKMVVPIKYTNLELYDGGDTFYAIIGEDYTDRTGEKSIQYGLLYNNDVILPCNKVEIKPLSENMFMWRDGEKYGLVSNGTICCECIYDGIFSSSSKGASKEPVRYSYGNEYKYKKYRYAILCVNEKRGAFVPDWNFYIPPQFDDVIVFVEEKFYLADGILYNVVDDSIICVKDLKQYEYIGGLRCYHLFILKGSQVENLKNYICVYLKNGKLSDEKIVNAKFDHNIKEDKEYVEWEKFSPILSLGCSSVFYSVKKRAFEEEISAFASYPELDYDPDEGYNYERDTYYALGGDDYDQWKENGGDLDGMMEGMGF